MVLEKDRKDQLDRSCEKSRNITKSQRGDSFPAIIKRMKAEWIDYILRGNCILKYIIEGKMKGRIKAKERDEELDVGSC
jgi:hypothetical protein